MPRPPKVSKENAIDVVKNFAHHFTTDDLPKYTSQVWKDMSEQLNGVWSAHDVYTAVREDRRDILSTARKDLGINVVSVDSKSIGESELDDEEVSDEFNNSCSASLVKLDLKLSKEEWDAIKPQGTVQYKNREKYILTPRVWTNIISIALWQQHKLPCAFSLKRADVALSSDQNVYKIKIVGSCKSQMCGNTLTATGEKHLVKDGLLLSVETHDTRGILHEEAKRPLNGKRRRQVQQELKAEGCKKWRNGQARLLMIEGDTEPPVLPKQGTLRNAKKELINAELNIKPEDGRDLIRAIENVSLAEEFKGLIHNTGSQPFYVFYSSPAQMQAYKDYCRVNRGKATIMLDATGGVVKKLLRSDGQLSGHIFLYSIVINFENTTLAVHQMLSETHVTDVIIYWLKQWIRRGAPVPNVTVTDYSRALIASLCHAYNNMTIKSYCEKMFVSSANPDQPSLEPATLIRIDVAHLINMVCRWKCFQSQRQRCIKEFFVRCISLLVDAQSIAEFRRIFHLILIVGIQSYEDSEIDDNTVSNAKEARETLETFIADRNIEVNFEAGVMEDGVDEIGSLISDGFGPSEAVSAPGNVDSPSLLVDSLTQHLDRAKVVIREGKNLNPFYLPDFVEKLFLLAKEFPLWSNAAIPYICERASSACVEGHFNDVKTRVFKNTLLPIRVDKFIKTHIRDIIGETLLFSSKIINFDKRQHISADVQLKKLVDVKSSNDREPTRVKLKKNEKKAISSVKDPDLMTQENWRKKASDENVENCIPSDDSADDCAESHAVPILESSEMVSADENRGIEFTAGLSSNDINSLNCSTLSDHTYCKEISSMERTDNTLSPSQTSTEQQTEQDLLQKTESNLQKQERVEEEEVILNPMTSEGKSKAESSKYFKPYPEIRQMNQLIARKKKAFLLPNGSLCKYPLSIDGIKVFLRLTCGFDSLIHALMTGALDDVEYANFLMTSSNETMEFVSKLINTGVTKELLQDRGSLLKKLGYTLNAEISTERRVLSCSMNATDSIINIVKKTLDTCPSVYVEEICPKCPRRTTTLPYLSPNHWKMRNNIGNLEAALEFRPEIYEVHCKRCTGTLKLHQKLNRHITIDMDIRESTTSGVAKKGLRCQLTEIPTTLSFPTKDDSRVTYRLVAVVTFAFDHFVTHSRRASGTWQLFNDMAKEITRSKINENIEPHLAVYIKQH